mmetsp:Transcript_27673/g.91984  ORF Transcript_27673/g.91984 Transcript_27673/m.91984 type:complete len:365 (-) Transcript_27673:2954-4048(-)
MPQLRERRPDVLNANQRCQASRVTALEEGASIHRHKAPAPRQQHSAKLPEPSKQHAAAAGSARPAKLLASAEAFDLPVASQECLLCCLPRASSAGLGQEAEARAHLCRIDLVHVHVLDKETSQLFVKVRGERGPLCFNTCGHILPHHGAGKQPPDVRGGRGEGGLGRGHRQQGLFREHLPEVLSIGCSGAARPRQGHKDRGGGTLDLTCVEVLRSVTQRPQCLQALCGTEFASNAQEIDEEVVKLGAFEMGAQVVSSGDHWSTTATRVRGQEAAHLRSESRCRAGQPDSLAEGAAQCLLRRGLQAAPVRRPMRRRVVVLHQQARERAIGGAQGLLAAFRRRGGRAGCHRGQACASFGDINLGHT